MDATMEKTSKQPDRSLPGINIDTIKSDYETALRLAAVTVRPETELRAYWFHYTKALFKKSQTLSYQTNKKTEKLVKMTMALPLLPEEHILPGIEILERMLDVNEQLSQFFVYLRRQRLPLRISVHRKTHRTNNLVESSHRDFYRFVFYKLLLGLVLINLTNFKIVSRPRPNIWVLPEKLQMLEHRKAINLEQLDAGYMYKRPSPAIPAPPLHPLEMTY
ncbi:hypothetical protein CBL_02952 [Carabus blaptoides fortunei]